MTQLSPIPELSFQEMLADPIVQTVMDRDGVTRRELEALIQGLRDRVSGRQPAMFKNCRQRLRAIAG